MVSMPWQKEEAEGEENSTKMDDQRELVTRLIQDEIRNSLDEELKRATRELLEEQRTAIRQMVEEQKKVIREAVDDERKAMWVRLEEVRQTLSKISLT